MPQADENPYAKFVIGGLQNDDPSAQKTQALNNPYLQFVHSPALDNNEIDVVRRSIDPDIETPNNIGFIEFSADIARGLDNSILSIPSAVGSSLQETGDLLKSPEAQKGIIPTFKESAGRRLLEYVEKNQETPGLLGAAKIFYGAQKDALLNAVIGNEAPAVLRDYGIAMIKQNEAALEFLGLKEPKSSKFAFDIGTGTGSVLQSLAATYITKNPAAAGAWMTFLVNSSDYQEAIKSGKAPEEAAQIAAVSAIAQGKVEGIGMGVFHGLSAASGYFKKVLFRAAEQSLEETVQATIEETVKGASGVRNTEIEQKIHNVLYQGAIGFIVGAPVSAVYTSMEDSANAQGIDGIQAKNIIKKFVENKDKVINGFAEIMRRESLGITNTENNKKKVSDAIENAKKEAKDIMPTTAEGVIDISNFTEEKQVALKEAGVVQTYTDQSGKQYSGVSPDIFNKQKREKAAAIISQQRLDQQERESLAVAPILSQQAAEQQYRLEQNQIALDDTRMNLLREVTNLQESKAVVDPEVNSLLEDMAASLAEVRRTPKPMTLTEFIKSKGGLRDQGGELQNLGIKNRSGIRNDKKGIDFDTAGELAAEAGYFSERPTVSEFLNAVESEAKGYGDIISEADIGIQSNLDELDNSISQLDKALGEKGIGADFRQRLTEMRRKISENRKIDRQIAREIKQREIEAARLEMKAKKIAATPPRILADKLKTFVAGMRKGAVLQKTETKGVQNSLISMIEESGLDAVDRARFIRTIKNTQTIDQLENNLPDIMASVERLAEVSERRDVITKIRRTIDRVSNSNIMSIDLVNKIKAMVGEIDLNKRMPKTVDSLRKTLDYMEKNPDVLMPRDVIEKLQILNKRPIGSVSTQELKALSDTLLNLEKQARAKFDLFQKKRERIKEQRLAELAKDSVAISSRNLAEADLGERLTAVENLKNSFAEARTFATKKGLALNPMDVFFDILDGAKNYVGANHKIFKATVDKAFGQYLDLRDEKRKIIRDLRDKYDLGLTSGEKIGVWAAMQQEGGKEKLFELGITQKEMDGLVLTKEETDVYNAMRDVLDSMRPQIQEVMRLLYNQDFVAVRNYFPFLTDFEATKNMEIKDMFGGKIPLLTKKNVRFGFTKERTLGKQKIRIDAFNVFEQHVDNAAYLIKMSEAVKSLGEVASSKEYGDMVGDLGQEAVVDWINLLARKGNIGQAAPIFDAIRRNIGSAVLGFRIPTMLIQASSLADAKAFIGSTYVERAILDVTKREWREFVVQNMPEIRDRAGGDISFLDAGGAKIINDIREAGYWGIKKLDAYVASTTAIAAYTQFVEKSGGTVDLSDPDQAAIEYAQLKVRQTQSSALFKDAPSALTQGKLTGGSVAWGKTVFQFQSFMFKRWGNIKHDIYSAGFRGGRTAEAINAATWLAIAMASEIAIRRGIHVATAIILAQAFGAYDDTEEWEETISKEAAIAMANNVPFVSQAVTSLTYNSNPVPIFSYLDSIRRDIAASIRTDDPEIKAKHAINAAVSTIGVATGLPVQYPKQLINEAQKE